jgi:lactoylglutathione lyase
MQADSSVSFNHAMIYSQDVEASLRFYTEALGLRPLELMLPYYARLQSAEGSSTIALHKAEGKKGIGQEGGIRLYFETPELEAAVQRVEKAGYTVKKPPTKMPWGWTHAYLDDPDGHEISIYWSDGQRLKSV